MLPILIRFYNPDRLYFSLHQFFHSLLFVIFQSFQDSLSIFFRYLLGCACAAAGPVFADPAAFGLPSVADPAFPADPGPVAGPVVLLVLLILVLLLLLLCDFSSSFCA